MPTDGTCLVCGQVQTLRRMRGHLLGHLAEGRGNTGAGSAFLVRITGYSPIRHWLYVRVGGRATLRTLDGLLRHVWLECCGHLSSFTSRYTSYDSSPPDGGGLEYGALETATMDVGAARTIGECGALRYEYDYGTTTELFVQMACECPGAGIKADQVQLLARNVGMPHDCTACGGEGAAVCLCVNCSWDEKETLMCHPCSKGHRHGGGDETHLLSVCNSPRMGMCAYQEYFGPPGPAEAAAAARPPAPLVFSPVRPL